MILVHTECGVLQVIQLDDSRVQILEAGTERVVVECEEIHITNGRIVGTVDAGLIWETQLVEAVEG